MLTGKILPAHPHSQPDELLSSWLIRIGHANGLKLQTFSAIVFGRDKAIWNRDIDKFAPDWMISMLAEITGTSKQAVLNTTLKSYEGVLYEQHQPHGNTKWILPLGVYHRTRHGHGLQFCPRCLEEDAVPYFRKQWRLAFSTVCTTHGCYLLDACPNCQAPLAPHRADMHNSSQSLPDDLHVQCWQCGSDLRSVQGLDATNNLWLRAQLQLESAIEQGYINWAGNTSMHSIVFFDGLRELVAGITSHQSRQRIEQSAALHGARLGDWPTEQIEMASCSTRREIFHVLAVALDSWPVNFAALIQECRLRYADLKGDSEYLRHWYEDVIQREAGGGFAAISPEEADAIVGAVITEYGRFSLGRARVLSGRDITTHIPDQQMRPVSDDVYEELLTSIDHQIAGTTNKVERACLIRDKVMFATGRQLRLSESDLAGLTLDRVRNIVTEDVNLDFTDAARTPAQVKAWVEWYWNKIRPNLYPLLDTGYLFLSARTHTQLRHSTVGRRFKTLVEAGMLHRSIPSYSNWF